MLGHESLCVSGEGGIGMDVTYKNSTDSDSSSKLNQGSRSDHCPMSGCSLPPSVCIAPLLTRTRREAIHELAQISLRNTHLTTFEPNPEQTKGGPSRPSGFNIALIISFDCSTLGSSMASAPPIRYTARLPNKMPPPISSTPPIPGREFDAEFS